MTGVIPDLVGAGTRGAVTMHLLALGGQQWMLKNPTAVQQLVDSFESAGRTCAATGRELTDAIALASAGIGWRSQTGAAAREVVAFRAEHCELAAAAYAQLAREVEFFVNDFTHEQSQLRQTITALIAAEAKLATVVAVPLAGLVDAALDLAIRDRRGAEADVAERVTNVRAAIARIQDCAQSWGARLDMLNARLAELTAAGGPMAWVTADAEPGFVSALQQNGVIDSPQQLQLLASMRAAKSPEQVRDLLAAMDPTALAGFLERHPELAVLLDRSMSTASFTQHPWLDGRTEQRLAQAISGGGSATDQARRVAAVWGSLDEDDRRRLALLFPAVIGSLGGVATKDRLAANRVRVVAALEVEQHKLLAAQRAKLGFPAPLAPVAEVLASTPMRNFVDTDLGYDTVVDGDRSSPNPFADEDAIRKRIALLQSLLGDSRVVNQPDRQLLVFDPAGDGRIAEVLGNIDTDHHVGGFVPGTTVAADSYDSYAHTMATMMQGDSAGQTALIVWMGADLPDAIIADAPDSRYADKAGQALVDFMVGLPISPKAADGSGVDVTVSGHSYGGAIVGTADKLGLPTNNVVHMESAGIGKGVWEVSDYPTADALGHQRDVQRYAQTTVWDPIHVSQGIMNRRGEDLAQLSGDSLPHSVRRSKGRQRSPQGSIRSTRG